MKFTWIGGPSYVLELGPFRIVGDPVLRDAFEVAGAGAVRRLTPLPAVDMSVADLVMVTSRRADHLDLDAVARCGARTALVPAGADVPGMTAIDAGGSMRLEKDAAALTIAAVPAGGDLGYFLHLESDARPFTAYVTGDTIFSETTREIQRTHGHANLLVIHAGAERAPDGLLRSADAKEAMQIVYRMQPNAIAAVHHGTFSHYTEPLAPLVEKIGLTIYEKRLRILREGESFEKVISPGE
ncbi:MAG TPA: hypothetical protein VFT13_12610 [Candidatus Krumholzibacteria bacterium]|nr:hypothetical protein [Candidatus Krumholzibacteria bacterium]